MVASSRSRNPCCPAMRATRASANVIHRAASTSGNSCCWPDPPGHSSVNVLLMTSLHLEVRLDGENRDELPAGLLDLAEWCDVTSRCRHPDLLGELPSRGRQGSSPGSYSPLATDQAPASLCAQNGPPGWTRKTSSSPRRSTEWKQTGTQFVATRLTVAAPRRTWKRRTRITAGCVRRFALSYHHLTGEIDDAG